ncbi:MAG: hypothetical protein WBF71_13895 [Microthrixaceae bacterium]
MSNRRWYNPHLPQTLVIGQLLLYFNAAFDLLDFLTGRISLSWAVTNISGLLIIAGIALSIFGAQGIANESKFGYQTAVAASFVPLIARLVAAAQSSGIASNISFIFFGNNVLNVMFEYALIALLLHPMSHHHQKVWFR